MNIILVHGVLGFDQLPSLVGTSAPRYFNGVAGHLRRLGHRVGAPKLDAVGPVKTRGDALVAFINDMKLGAGERVHIIAHSMGGLDARYAIAKTGNRVASLVAIGTPHRGSPVADAIVHGSGPLAGRLPGWLADAFRGTALHDLTTAVATTAMKDGPDAPGVRYIDVAGDASRGHQTLALFHVAAIVGGITGEINDGVVTRASALVDGHRHLADWSVDHAGEIGWGYHMPVLPDDPGFFGQLLNGWSPVREHFARYEAIVAALR